MYACTCVYVYMHVRVCMYVCMHACMCVYMHVRVCMYVCMHAWIRAQALKMLAAMMAVDLPYLMMHSSFAIYSQVHPGGESISVDITFIFIHT